MVQRRTEKQHMVLNAQARHRKRAIAIARLMSLRHTCVSVKNG